MYRVYDLTPCIHAKITRIGRRNTDTQLCKWGISILFLTEETLASILAKAFNEKTALIQ